MKTMGMEKGKKENWATWSFTARVIAHALWPGTRSGAQKSQPEVKWNEGFIDFTKIQLSNLVDLRFALNQEQQLKLFFGGCRMPAAPFLLFRLKRQGFSNCKASVTRDGVFLNANI